MSLDSSLGCSKRYIQMTFVIFSFSINKEGMSVEKQDFQAIYSLNVTV